MCWSFKNLSNAWSLAVLAFSLTAVSPPPNVLARSTSNQKLSHIIKSSHPVPDVWQPVRRVPRDSRIQLQIGLRPGQFDELERHLHEVSDPDHYRYGQHLSLADVQDLVSPTQESCEIVQAWLASYGIEDYRWGSAKDWLTINTEVSVAEQLLDAEYFAYRHADHGTEIFRTPHWSLPESLHDHIEAIHPTDAFIGNHRRSSGLLRRSEVAPIGLGRGNIPSYDELAAIDRKQMGHMDIPDIRDMPEHPTPDQACNRVATSPLCLRTLYGTLDYTPQAPNKTSIGIVNYLEQVNNKSDIENFLGRYRPEALGASYKIKTEIVAGGSDYQGLVTPEQAKNKVGVEGNLNAETVIGLAYPIPITTYNVGGRGLFRESLFTTENRNEPYLEWLQYILDQPHLPQVITTSYADEEQTIPYWYAKRVCQGFAQLGARGVSIFFASGDNGVGSDDKCFTNDGKNKPTFLPTFPASCPYVTTVGGTRGWNPEIVGFDARRTFVTGGGFSNYFERPSYQKDVVDAYVNSLGSMYHGLYNKNGRGYPDISARGYHYISVWNGTARLPDGTSASAPAMAAIFALVNEALAAEGKPALGWLNPWLYSKGFKGFKDVLAGSNTGCNTAGFPAKEGWDAASGFGTPWFPALKEVAMQRNDPSKWAKPWYMPS